MVNYACAFSQSELGKYFEWIITGVKDPVVVVVNIEGISREVLVDSGSASNLVRMQQELIWPWRHELEIWGNLLQLFRWTV